MIANYLADSAEEWVNIFSTENSGTYNNQWMIFDMKRFTKGEPLPPGTFWVAEQLPGGGFPFGITAADQSAELTDRSYWASYNLPFYPNVFNLSGVMKRYAAEGDLYSYSNCSRARIFRRNQSAVNSVTDMELLMRYNNFQHDPLSRIPNCADATGGVCHPPYSAMLAVAARGDLNPKGGEAQYGIDFRSLALKSDGTTDAKVAAWSRVTSQWVESTIANGPTSIQQPIFRWSTSPFANDSDIVRDGLPDEWTFGFVTVAVSMPLVEQSVPLRLNFDIVVGSLLSVVVAGVLIFLVVRSCRRSVDKGVQTALLN
jgi:hypothetical protein